MITPFFSYYHFFVITHLIRWKITDYKNTSRKMSAYPVKIISLRFITDGMSSILFLCTKYELDFNSSFSAEERNKRNCKHVCVYVIFLTFPDEEATYVS